MESLLILGDVIYNQTLIFINKNWPNDLRIGCNPLLAIELIETNVYLKELEELEKTLEEMKLWNFKIWINFFLQFTIFHLFLAIIKV